MPFRQHKPRTLPTPRKAGQDSRPNAYRRGYNRDWQRRAKAFLRAFPYCAECERQGLIGVPAKCVDHITPHRGDMDLFHCSDEELQALCWSCHSRKTSQGG